MSVLINPRDLQFLLFELLDVEKLFRSDRHAHCDKAMFERRPSIQHTGSPWSNLSPLPKFVTK